MFLLRVGFFTLMNMDIFDETQKKTIFKRAVLTYVKICEHNTSDHILI